MIYSQRSLVVLALLGSLSAIMSVMSVILIFQLQALQASLEESSSVEPTDMPAILRPVCTVLSALSLTLNLSSVVICLLHSYVTTEICRGEDDTQRANWFLLDNRTVRHAAIGLFCFGISVYLSAMSIYMLLVFEIETGIASVCVLSSGVVVLLVIVVHTLFRTARIAKNSCKLHNTVLENDPECSPGVHTSERARPSGQASVRHQVSHQFSTEHKQQYSQSIGPRSQEAHSGSVQMHKALSTESGLFQAQAKPWNGVNNEMRTVLARKATCKDSTLV